MAAVVLAHGTHVLHTSVNEGEVTGFEKKRDYGINIFNGDVTPM